MARLEEVRALVGDVRIELTNIRTRSGRPSLSLIPDEVNEAIHHRPSLKVREPRPTPWMPLPN